MEKPPKAVKGRVVASRYMSETTAAGVKSTATTTRPSTNTAASARTTVKPPTAKALRPTTTAVKPQPTTRPTSAQEHSIAPKRTIGKHSKELEILRSQYTQTAYLKHCAEKAFSALEMDVLEKLNVMTRECCELEDTVRQMESEFIESELEHRMAHHIDQQYEELSELERNWDELMPLYMCMAEKLARASEQMHVKDIVLQSNDALRTDIDALASILDRALESIPFDKLMESKENRQRHLQVSMEVNQERESLQQLHRQTVRAASKQQIVEIAKHLGLG